MNEYDIVISIDVGLTGAIVIFEGDEIPKIHEMPLQSIIRNKKKKNIYDYKEIVKILKPYKDKNVLYGVETQGVRPGEGGVSAMTSGTGYGFLQGVGYSFEFEVTLIHPRTWKKIYPEMITEEAKVMIAEKKVKSKEAKVMLAERKEEIKNIKDKELKKQYKKETDDLAKGSKKQIDKLGRSIKASAKAEARKIAKNMYPELEKEFIRVKDDGKADATLIGKYMLDAL